MGFLRSLLSLSLGIVLFTAGMLLLKHGAQKDKYIGRMIFEFHLYAFVMIGVFTVLVALIKSRPIILRVGVCLTLFSLVASKVFPIILAVGGMILILWWLLIYLPAVARNDKDNQIDIFRFFKTLE